LAALNKAWIKFSTYYTHIDESTWYIAGLVFHPELKWAYLEDAWEPAWIATAKTAMQALWKNNYKPMAKSTTKDTQLPTDPQTQTEVHELRQTLRDQLNAAQRRQIEYYNQRHTPKAFKRGGLVKLSTRNLKLKDKKRCVSGSIGETTFAIAN
jgi:hypothetical protein